GINASNHILYDSHRDDGVSVETDGIMVAMTFPETSLHWRICHSVPERHIRQCRSWSMSFDVLSPGLRFAPPWALLCRAVGTGSRFISAYSDVDFFSYKNAEGILNRKDIKPGNIKLKQDLILWHKTSMR
ncbi:MAG: hypothetical protein IKB16_09355, partial [Lentisphaeria bacterium]|nr:hypothetical protein [Lentisphaeria bacterium]